MVTVNRYIDQDQLIHDAMQSEAEITDQMLYTKYIEKNTGKGEVLLTSGIAEYERYMFSASGDEMLTLTDTYSYTKWLSEPIIK